MTFGTRLRQLREKAGLTQDDLGKGLATGGENAGKQVVLGWEKNRHFPKVDQLAAICKRHKWSADYLLFGTTAGAAWPFSAELHAKVSKLEPDDIAALEAVMRAHLRMAPLDEALRQSARDLEELEQRRRGGDQAHREKA